MKSFIISPTYRIVEGKAQVLLYGRLENGKSFLSIHDFEPYFWIRHIDKVKAESVLKELGAQNIRIEDSDFHNFSREKMSKIILAIPGEVRELRKILGDQGVVSYEADIRFAYRFLIDHDLKGSLEIEGKPETEEGFSVDCVFSNPRIRPVVWEPRLRTLSIDIETNADATAVFAISLYNEEVRKVLLVHEKKFRHAESFRDEKALLEAFAKEIRTIDPDIITGWNVIDFDFKVLRERFRHHGIPFTLGRSRDECELRLTESYYTDSSARFPGRAVLDGIHLMKMSFIRLDDYKLNTAAKTLLGEEKLITSEHRFEEIERIYREETQKLVDYNLKDAKLVHDILEKTKVLELTVRRSMLTRMQPDRVKASIASLDSLYLRELKERKLVAPSARGNDRGERIKGGFVMDSKPGIYDSVIVLDFKSLYPSIIRTFNIDPASFVPQDAYMKLHEKEKAALIEAPNGAHFRNEDGILPQLIEELWKQRDAAKKRKDPLASQAIKILMNCFSPDTQIMTEHGIKNIKEVKVGERVYSLNPATGLAELHPVSKTFAYRYSGPMIGIHSGSTDFLVTPNHRFLVSDRQKYVWREAGQLEKQPQPFWLPKHEKIPGKKDRILDLAKMCTSYQIPFRVKSGKLQRGPKHSAIPQKFMMKDWLSLLGWYVSEGFIYTTLPKKYEGKSSWRGVSRKVNISQKIPAGRSAICALFSRMGLRHHLDVNGVFVCNHILADVLEREAGKGSAGKRIPSWVFALDSSLLQHLFATLMQGDGNRNGQRYSSLSKTLAEDVLRLVHHLGLSGYVYEDTSSYKGKPHTMYRVQINRQRGIRPYISKYHNISKKKFTGKVYCVEVKPHHTVLAGRNYKFQYCGQSFFGVLANPNCRFYSLEMANAITHFGQFLNKLTAEKIREQGYEVIYGDTDSIFIDAPGADMQTADKVGRELQEYINAFYQAYIRKTFNRTSYLELEFDRAFRKFLMPRVRGSEEGAKKRYAGLVDEGGKERTIIVGMEFVRRDWTEVAKTFQFELLSHIFHDKPVEKYVRDFVEGLRGGKMDAQLIYRKAIRKGVSQYTKTTPPHIKAARKLGRELPGIIEYVMTKNGPEPLEKNPSPIDYEHYIEKQIRPIADALLSFQDKSFDDLVAKHKQTGLGDFG